jgi:ABC-type nickel/cobalt efflux system permease component RcnA
MPAPKDLEGPWSWRKAVPLAFAIGIRPCTGAIAVLIFALSQGLVWAGVFATFAMAIGTAITVSVLAALAAGSRDLAVKLGGGDGGWGASIRSAAGIGGSLAVIGLGLMLFLGSLRAAAVF